MWQISHSLLLLFQSLFVLNCFSAFSISNGQEEILGEFSFYKVTEVVKHIGPYPDLVAVHKCRRTTDGKHFLVAGYAVFNGNQTKFGTIRNGHNSSGRLVSFKMANERIVNAQRVDDTEDFESPLYWWMGSEKLQPVEHRQNTRLNKAGLLASVIAASGDHVTGGVNSPFFFFSGSREYYVTSPKALPFENRYSRFLTTVEEFDRHLREQDIHLLAIVVPQSSTIYPGLAANIQYDPDRDGRVNFHIGDLAEKMRVQGIDTIDLTDIFLQERYFKAVDGNTYPIYYEMDTHWAPQGVYIASRVIQSRIRQILSMDNVSSDEFSMEKEMSKYSGDIRHLKSKGAPTSLPKALPVQLLRIKGSSDSAQSILASNTPTARVHVVGDSFVDQGRSTRSDLTSHLKSTLGEDVFLSFARGNPSAARNKWLTHSPLDHAKVVVWVFSERFCAVPELWNPFDASVRTQ